MANLDELESILAQAGYSSSAPGISPVGQAIATGSALPSYGTPRFTPFEAQTYQTMTPAEGALMTPGTFGELSAEQRSAIELESELERQRLLEASKPSLGVRITNPAGAFLANLGDTAALGFGSELAAALESPFSSKTYGELIREAGTQKEEMFAANPIASIGGTVTGAALPLLMGGGATLMTAQAGRMAPTLAERLILSTTPSELKTLANIENLTTVGGRLLELSKVGALQGAVTGAGAAEPTVGEGVGAGLAKRAIGGTLGAAFGAAAPFVTAGAIGAGKAVLSPMQTLKSVAQKLDLMPMSTQKVNATVADIAEGAGITEAGLRAAKEQIDASGNPLLQTLTTNELVPTKGGIALQKVAQQKSSSGSEQFWAQEKQQVARINQELADVVDNIDVANPADARTAQKNAQLAIKQRAEEVAKQGNAKYEALPEDIEYSRGTIKDKLSDIYNKVFAPGRGKTAESIQYAFDYINKRMFQEGGKLSRRMFGKAESAPTTISARELIDLRSGLLAAGRDLAERNPEQARLANELAKEVHDFIKTDSRIANQFSDANAFWDEYIDTFHSGQLVNIADPKIVAPETINQLIASNSSAWQQWTKQTGGNVKLFKEQLAIQFEKFKNAGVDVQSTGGQIKAKLAALDDIKKLVEGTPAEKSLQETYDLANKALKNIEELLQRSKGATEVLPPEFSQNMLKQMDLGDLAMIASQASEKATGAPKKAFAAAVRQFTRDKLRQSFGRGLGGAATGGLLGYAIGQQGQFSPSSVAAGAAAAGALAAAGLRSGSVAAQNAQLLNDALVTALRNPEDMLKAFAARTIENNAPVSQAVSSFLGTTGAGKASLRAVNQLTSALSGKAASAIVPSEQKTAAPTPTPADAITELRSLLNEVEKEQASSAPTSTVEKIASAIIPSASAEEVRKPKSGFPVVSEKQLQLVERAYKLSKDKMKSLLSSRYNVDDVKRIAKKYDKLTQAQIAVESNFNHASVSKAGAIGAMQIMPATARGFKVNPFNLEDNIKAGKALREKLTNRFKDSRLALMAYNWGEGNVSKALKWLSARNKKPTYENILRYANAIDVPAEARLYAARVQKALRSLGE